MKRKISGLTSELDSSPGFRKAFCTDSILRLRVVSLFFLCFCCVFLSEAQAQTSIAVVDVKRLLTESMAAKSIHEQTRASRESFLTEISQREQELREEEKQLLAAQKELSPEEYAQKRQSYEKDLLETRRIAQKHKQRIEEAANRGMDILRDELYVAVRSIANERGYDLVISSKNVIAGANSLDITEETLKLLDERIPDIRLTFSEE